MNLVIFEKDGSVMGYTVSEFGILDNYKEIFWKGTDGREEEWLKKDVRAVLVDGVKVWESGEDKK
jgi:hypothetical protein